MTVSTSYSSYSSYSSCSSHDFGHVVATNGGMLALTVWDDANSNQEIDGGETVNRSYFSVTGHSMSVTNRLDYGNFDRDGDNLPDWWEVANGLSASGAATDEYADPDNDGLINLHEFWAGTNPLVPDGSNTLLSVVCRSTDDLLNAASPVYGFNKFSDYYSNGSNLVFNLNSDFWLGSIDTTCCSMWQDSNVNIWNGHTDPWHMGGTLISSNHVVYAFHYGLPVGTTLYFRGSSGTIYSRELM